MKTNLVLLVLVSSITTIACGEDDPTSQSTAPACPTPDTTGNKDEMRSAIDQADAAPTPRPRAGRCTGRPLSCAQAWMTNQDCKKQLGCEMKYYQSSDGSAGRPNCEGEATVCAQISEETACFTQDGCRWLFD